MPRPANGERRADVAFVIPIYNEEPVVGSVVRKVLAQYAHVICVNDASTDGSAAAVAGSGAVIVQHPFNMGQGAALQTGLEFVRLLPGLRWVVTFDADGQHSLDDVGRMLAVAEESGADVVLGSRFLGAEPQGMPRLKRAALRTAIRFSNAVSGLRLSDTHNGLRVLSRRVVNEIQLTTPDMSHASEILEIIAARQYTYQEVPVTIAYTDYSRSKGQSVINAINIAFDTLLRKVLR